MTTSQNNGRANAMRNTRRAAWRVAGLCIGCGGVREAHYNNCRQCLNYVLASIATHRDEHLAKRRGDYHANRDKHLAASKKWREENKEVKAAIDKRAYDAKRDNRKAKARAYYSAHKDKAHLYAKEKRAKRLAAGLCSECGARRDPERKLCSGCVTRLNESRRRWAACSSRDHMAKIYRNSTLKRLYGLTAEEWTRLFESQDRRCMLCGTDKPGARGWQTDHCHASGKIRSILCNQCNVGLGCFKDNPDVLAKAIEYLRKHNLTLAG